MLRRNEIIDRINKAFEGTSPENDPCAINLWFDKETDGDFSPIGLMDFLLKSNYSVYVTKKDDGSEIMVVRNESYKDREIERLQSEIKRLKDREWFLDCLEACGVDNWSEYSDARAMYNGEEMEDW